jgi:3-oxoacyl-[acyl-carrier protein] reductase
MELNLKGKTVFIAGASRGIGFGMAQAFAREGAKLALTARGEATLDQAKAALVAEGAKEADLITIAGDMTQSATIAAALDATEAKLGPIHCAIGNVGISKAPFGYEVSDELWATDIAQNFYSAVYLAREAVKRILARPAEAREGANIILISSIAGVNGLASQLTYGAAKAGMNHFTRDLAKVVGREGVRVNAIAPGNILFEGGTWERNLKARPGVYEKWVNREVALRRFGKVEEIADAALFLASPRASFVTGEVLVVDGGQVR